MRTVKLIIRLVTAVLGWLALAACTVLALRSAGLDGAGGGPGDPPWRTLELVGWLWLLFGFAAWRLVSVPVRAAVPMLLAGGIGLQALAIGTAAPTMTDDYTRYAWDGRVQTAAISPYRHPPAAQELSPLRDEWLFPGGVPRVDRPDEPGFYPPGAQLYFVTTTSLSGSGAGHLPWQIGAGLLAVATTVGLVAVLRHCRRDPRLAVLWAWCPTVFLEAGHNGHVDVLAALLVALGVGVLATKAGLSRGTARLGGVLLGAALSVKLLAVVVVAALSPHRLRTVLAAATTALGLLYLPHLLTAGPQVLRDIPRFLAGEGFGGGEPTLLPLALPTGIAPYVAAVTLLAVAVWVWRHPDAAQPWRGPLVMTGATLLVLGPSYPWYALLLVVLVALDGRWEWLTVAAAGYAAYFAGTVGLTQVAMQAIGYGSALGVILLVGTGRRLRPWLGSRLGERRAGLRVEEVQPVGVQRQ